MKKSVFTFGLLMSSLVMLSAMPLFNNNNAAMAQGYNGDSYYSQYPTDDKKYECRTGPFEGFFVGSVEFCKFNKFGKDDRKDNRVNQTGTQGSPGPQGPIGPAGPPGSTGATGATGQQGIQGIQGETGITFLNGTNLYRVVTNLTVAGPDDFFLTSFAECDSGDAPVNGLSLYAPTLQFRGNGTLALSGTVSNETGIEDFFALPTGYITTAFDVSENDVVQSSVTCFDNPPLR